MSTCKSCIHNPLGKNRTSDWLLGPFHIFLNIKIQSKKLGKYNTKNTKYKMEDVRWQKSYPQSTWQKEGQGLAPGTFSHFTTFTNTIKEVREIQ